jgi:hypothetical protein
LWCSQSQLHALPGSGIKGRLTLCEGSHDFKEAVAGKMQREWWKFWA